MPDFDTVLHPDWVVPIAPRREVFTGFSVALKDGQIAAIAPRDQAQNFDADEHVALASTALMPGLINSTAMPPWRCSEVMPMTCR